MTEQEEARIRELLKQSLRPAQAELSRDLSPQMLARLQARAVTVPWFDWVLLGALAICLCLVPSAIPVLLYNL